MDKNWLVISWQHIDHMDGRYGRCLAEFIGNYDEAAEFARKFVPEFSPVGVVEVIE